MKVKLLASRSIEKLEQQINNYLTETKQARDNATVSISAATGNRDSSPTLYAVIITNS